MWETVRDEGLDVGDRVHSTGCAPAAHGADDAQNPDFRRKRGRRHFPRRKSTCAAGAAHWLSLG